MRALLLMLFGVLVCVPGLASAETAFVPGQVWSLSGAYPQSRLLIGKLETVGIETVVHVTVMNVPVSDASGNLLGETTIGHMPYAESALRRSVGALLEEGHAPFEQFGEGYQQWKDANGGFFTVTVAEGIGIVLQTIHSAQAE